MEVEVPMPEEIDLEALRAHGQQPGEQLQPEEPAAAAVAGGGGAAAAAAPPVVVPDETVVMTLVSMGFTENAGKRAGRVRRFRTMLGAWVSEHATVHGFRSKLALMGLRPCYD